MRRCAYKHLSLVVLCCEGFLNPISLHCVDYSHVVRLEAVLSRLNVAVEPSKIKIADADVLLGELRGATGPYLSFVHDMPLAKQQLPGEF